MDTRELYNNVQCGKDDYIYYSYRYSGWSTYETLGWLQPGIHQWPL